MCGACKSTINEGGLSAPPFRCLRSNRKCGRSDLRGEGLEQLGARTCSEEERPNLADHQGIQIR
jgi:hypothetical protein